MENKLDVNVNEIHESISMMFENMVGGIIEMLGKLPKNELVFSDVIYKALNTSGVVSRYMLPVKNGSYIEKIYLKENEKNELVVPYAKAMNGEEYYINDESFYWMLNLCEFIQTYC